MSKIFRLHTNGATTSEGWYPSKRYGAAEIDNIEDPNGANIDKPITSIPSPFARMDLVNTAFKIVADAKNLGGDTIYHKLIADCLDMAQMCFSFDKYQRDVEIIEWNVAQGIGRLTKAGSDGHQLLGNTLDLFLKQDADTYHFDEVSSFYLFNYKSGPDTLNIIGGTSPVSLFFTSANDLSYTNMNFGTHKAFASVTPLYKRDIKFQEYMYALRQTNAKLFAHYFRGVNDYLDENYKLLSASDKETINLILNGANHFAKDFSTLNVTGGNPVKIVGDFSLYKQTFDPATITANSDFVIRSTKIPSLPLVLPNSKFNYSLKYVSSNWDAANLVAPTTIALNQRVLPFDGSPYPYLCIDDFLEPFLIETVYPIDGKKFFDGNIQYYNPNDTSGYLIPLKSTYFDYFNIADLQDLMTDGKKVFEIVKSATGGVTVTLRIPIQKDHYITYERLYYPSPANAFTKPDIAHNKGAIVSNKFSLVLYPFLKAPVGVQNEYRIALIDADIQPLTKNNKYQLGFYNDQNQLTPATANKQRSNKNNDKEEVSTDIYVYEGDIQYVSLNDGSGHQALVLPLFKIATGTDAFTFTVDFGTTNTHIEYSVGKKIEALTIDADAQLATLYDPTNERTKHGINNASAGGIITAKVRSLMPRLISDKGNHSFPTRTAIAYNASLKPGVANYALADANLAFFHGKELATDHVSVDLKWTDFSIASKEQEAVNLYLANLMLLMRNKVLLNGGDLKETKIIWFYPISMSLSMINTLDNQWNKLYKTIIKGSHLPVKMSESIAPYYYFNQQMGVVAGKEPVVNIDMGGGTTDMVIFTNGVPQIISSFRFASNAVFGDGYGGSFAANGFVNKYKSIFQDLLDDNKLYNLSYTFGQIQERKSSTEICNFFFSLENNKEIKDKKLEDKVSFNVLLTKDGDLRIVFLLFYVSVVYHLAQLMKSQGLNAPRYITFTGTASKLINIADTNLQLSGLSLVTNAVFKEVYGLPSTISLKQIEIPKEVTCKGGLLADHDTHVEVDDLKLIYLNDNKVLTASAPLTYAGVNQELMDTCLTEYQQFIEVFCKVAVDLKFKDRFGVAGSIYDYKQVLLQDAAIFIEEGLRTKEKELGPDYLTTEIEESFFFYPLKGSINKLVTAITTNTFN